MSDVMFDGVHPVWPGLEAFYDEDEARRHSPEDDFGVRWAMEDHTPCYRLSRLDATGEVIMVSPERVELVGWTPTLDVCRKVLKDWEHNCHGVKSYYWVRKRFLVASGHRGVQERNGNTHMGDEVTAELRQATSGPPQTMF